MNNEKLEMYKFQAAPPSLLAPMPQKNRFASLQLCQSYSISNFTNFQLYELSNFTNSLCALLKGHLGQVGRKRHGTNAINSKAISKPDRFCAYMPD